MNIKNQIPNSITGLNLFSGCISIVFAFENNYLLSIIFILLAGLFDFFDGMVARILKVKSDIGKELDSLADVVSFGVAPAMIIFCYSSELIVKQNITDYRIFIPYISFIVPVFSAFRLAKFNLDSRQTDFFLGLPTPANAMLLSSLVLLPQNWSIILNIYALAIISIILSILLISEIPLIALKFKSFSFKDNTIRYIFLIGCLILITIFLFNSITFIIIWYIIISLVNNILKNKSNK